MPYEVPVPDNASCPTPGTTTSMLVGGQPPVSRYVTVNWISVAGVPARGDAFGAGSWMSCDAPGQLAARAMTGHGPAGQIAGRASIATRSPTTPAAITRPDTPLACTIW